MADKGVRVVILQQSSTELRRLSVVLSFVNWPPQKVVSGSGGKKPDGLHHATAVICWRELWSLVKSTQQLGLSNSRPPYGK